VGGSATDNFLEKGKGDLSGARESDGGLSQGLMGFQESGEENKLKIEF
jgi:hypothetical protein